MDMRITKNSGKTVLILTAPPSSLCPRMSMVSGKTTKIADDYRGVIKFRSGLISKFAAL